MPAPIVHIGFHKTATSWFQKNVYPFVTSHRLIDRDLVRRTFMDGDAFDFDPADARAALGIADGPEPPPLICEEQLSGVLHIDAASTFIAKEVATRLHATLPDARIVVFTRSQVDAAAFWYMQYLKEGGAASAKRYFFPDEYLFPGRLMKFKTARFDFAQPDYRGLIEHYDRLFGQENVLVLPYEELVDDPAGVVEQMRRRFGFDLAPGAISKARVNQAYRRGLIPVARALSLFSGRGVANKRMIVHVPFGYRMARFVLDRLNQMPLFGARASADRLIDKPTARWIGQRFAVSNRWLEERTGRDLAALGYGVAAPSPAVPQPRRPKLTRWSRK